MAQQRLVDALTNTLSLCEALGLRFQKINLDDAPTLMAYADLIESEGVTGEILERNRERICLLKEFPVPADIIELCADDIAASRRQGYKPYKLPPTEKHPLGREIACLEHDLTPEQVEERWQKSYPEEPRALPVSPELLERRRVLRAEEQEV